MIITSQKYSPQSVEKKNKLLMLKRETHTASTGINDYGFQTWESALLQLQPL